jgi:hypothetical protein
LSQVTRSAKDSKKFQVLYRCPLNYLCDCKVAYKIFYTAKEVVLKVSGRHDGNSHVDDRSRHLSVAQKAALKRATKSAPNESARQLVRNSSNFSPEKRTALDPDSIRSAQRVVSKQRRALALKHTQGIRLDKTNGKMTELGEKLDLTMLIARHNDPQDEYHLNLHEVVCIGNQWKDGVTFMALTTPGLLFNVGLALQSGWSLHFQADGSFDYCSLQARRYSVWSQFLVRNFSARFLVHGSQRVSAGVWIRI